MNKLKNKYEILTENNKKIIVYKTDLLNFVKKDLGLNLIGCNFESNDFCLDLLQLYLEYNDLITEKESYSI